MLSKDDPERVYLNIERIKYWLSVGAQPTDRVTKFLAKEGLAEKPVITKQTKQNKPKKKTLEKAKAKEEKLKSKQEMSDATAEASSVEAPQTLLQKHLNLLNLKQTQAQAETSKTWKQLKPLCRNT